MANISETYHIRLHGMFHESVLIIPGATPRAEVFKIAQEWKDKHFPYRDVCIVSVKETLIKTI